MAAILSTSVVCGGLLLSMVGALALTGRGTFLICILFHPRTPFGVFTKYEWRSQLLIGTLLKETISWSGGPVALQTEGVGAAGAPWHVHHTCCSPVLTGVRV